MEIELYETAAGHCPFDDWFESLRELHTRAKILTRLDCLQVGNFGDCKAIGDGIAELRIHARAHKVEVQTFFNALSMYCETMACSARVRLPPLDERVQGWLLEALSRSQRL